MTVVLDASALAGALIATDHDARWAESTIEHERLLAPHQIFAEVANVLRRAAMAGQITAESATSAHRELLLFPFTLCEYEPFADRIWQLRESVTVYDAWYVAIAEAFDAPLVTLDLRLPNAAGPRCAFLTPPGR
ncbi:type II toxin-antitoxin system VapC family toxin [Microbacterium sp. LRZ72]|uniref:type II toxin-antitoxin system VapC family toxin n=1 Tax=Microbacterium sp. LRZ72 TaxID=2942481 RepID=UPI0029B75798|nr:type II toxin-antitoxin system VapC family toxin [Microbacterium sp. LRZ72]MDX2377650.1 type II toxin-antitoxin system VapC family toxin [Microbacterium sp. LRZ72]